MSEFRYESFLKEAAAFSDKVLKLYADGNGISQSELAKKFKVSRQRINQIVNRKAQQARHTVKRAVAGGRLPRPKTQKCADCGKPAAEYDHRDYSKRLAVDPVCLPCHRKRGRGKNGK